MLGSFPFEYEAASTPPPERKTRSLEARDITFMIGNSITTRPCTIADCVWNNFGDQKPHETKPRRPHHHPPQPRSNNNLFGRQGSFRQQLRERN